MNPIKNLSSADYINIYRRSSNISEFIESCKIKDKKADLAELTALYYDLNDKYEGR